MLAIDFLNVINKYSLEEYFSKFGEIEQGLHEIEIDIKRHTKGQQANMLDELADWAQKAKPFCRIHLLSFCMSVSGESCYTEEILKEVIDANYNEIGEYNKLSHFEQVSCAVFQRPNLGNTKVEELLSKLYMQNFRAFQRSFGLEKGYIPLQKRNSDLVFVFTSQILGMNHAPTKTILDRCFVLKKTLKKEVYIINTAMRMPRKGQAPFYGLQCGTYSEKFCNVKEVSYKGEYFGFHQCSNNMPDLDEIANIICLLVERKPLYILQIGGDDICADLCGLLIPKITVSTVFSKVAMSCGEYQIVDKNLNQDDCNILQILGVQPKNVKRAMFTFSFKEQTHHFSREELRLPNDAFTLLVVGWRLDEEVDYEFLEMLENTVIERKQIVIAFMGKFLKFKEKMIPFPKLQMHAYNLGEQEDALAVTECCDLYVNPKRNGGGSSVAEALYKGLPAVTLPMGDVSVATGNNFWVSDYQEMKKKIIKYYEDTAYYETMSKKAQERAKQLMDSDTAFGNVMREIEKSILSQ